MTSMWDGLDAFEQKIDDLMERARILRQPRPAKGREIAQVLVQEVGPITRFDYTTKEITYYNGDDRDLVIDRLTCVVYKFNDAGTYIVLPRTGGTALAAEVAAGVGAGGGWGRLSGGLAAGANPLLFDFSWNFRRDVTQARYSRAPVSSFALGDLQQKRFLEFARPLVIKKGEGIVLEVTPTLFRGATSGADAPNGYQFIVSFLGLGHRRQPE